MDTRDPPQPPQPSDEGKVPPTAAERRQQITADINAVAAQLDREHKQVRRRPTMPQPPQSRGTQVLAIIKVIGLIAFVLGLWVGPWILFGGLYLGHRLWPARFNHPFESGKRPPGPPTELVEALDVEGDCAENHVKDTAPYKGRLTHQLDLTTGAVYGSGHVSRTPHAHVSGVMHVDRYGYDPPFSIWFTRLSPDDLQGDVLQLVGLSDNSSVFEGEPDRPSYRATCTLRVTRRLDQRPSRQDETAQ